MKAVVFGYHNIGVMGIQKLLSHGFEIPLVFTHADSAQENIWFGSVAEVSRQMGLEYVTPENPNAAEWIARIRAIQPDIIFSFYYRYMITEEILKIPPLGAYNLHGSLLPAYRGRCPVNWVIIKGEKQTGVTLHEMVEQPDAGDLVAQIPVVISADDTAESLFGKIEEAAGRMLDQILPEIRQGHIPKEPQDLSKGSYFGSRKPEDGRISWGKSASEIYNLIRGVTRPYPGAFGFFKSKKVIIWWARLQEDVSLCPGAITLSGASVLIGTGKGAIVPLDVESEGYVYKEGEVAEFFASYQGETMK